MPDWRDAGAAGYLRAATADRERAIDVLKAGFAEGRLTKDEYDARVSQAYAARTYGELAVVTADLPGGQVVAPAWHPVVPVTPRTNPLAIASLVCGLAQPFLGLTTIPAIVLGYMARGQIRRTGEDGNGLATAGLVLGWIGISVVVLAIVLITIVAWRSGSPAPPANGPAG